MKTFIKILREIWQLPQHIIAYAIIVVNHKSIKQMVNKDGIRYYLVNHLSNCGISLGNYIFLDADGNYDYITVKHEHGHQIQSLIFGPLYLIVIGLPSIIGNIINIIKYKYFRKYYDPDFYYKQPWEAWADKLGKVVRKTHKDFKGI